MSIANYRWWFVAAAIGAALVWLAYALGSALQPLVVAFFIAYLLFPLVQKLEGWGITRIWAISVTVILLAGLLTGLSMYAIPIVYHELARFLSTLPKILHEAAIRMEHIVNSLGFSLSLSKEALQQLPGEQASKLSFDILRILSKFSTRALGNVVDGVLAIFNMFLFPVFFFYILRDFERITGHFESLLPPRHRAWWQTFFSKANDIMSGYIRGQLMVALLLALLYGTGLKLIGLPFGFIIGFISGLLNIVPYVGFTVGIASALLTALAYDASAATYGGVLGVYAIVQGLEGTIITPKIIGDRVGLNALLTLLALIIGGNVGGLFGMLVAIPLAGIVLVLLREARQHYFNSKFYSSS